MNQDATIAIILIIVVIAGTYFIGPRLASGFDSLLDRIGDFIDTGWISDQNATKTDKDDGELNKDFTGEYSGSGYVGATILYKDGSTKHFKLEGLNILPLKIMDNQGFIVSITVEAWVTAEFTGTLTGISISGTLDVDIVRGQIGDMELAGHCVDTSISNTISNPSFSSGDTFKLWETTYTEATIEGWFALIFPDDEVVMGKNLQYEADVTVTFEWATMEETATLSASAIHSINRLPDEQLASVSLTINPNRLYEP